MYTMVIAKKDLATIKGVVRQVVHGEVENLARIVARGFEGINKRFEQVDKRFEQVDRRLESVEGRLDHVDARLGVIERDIAEIRRHFVYRDEFEDALARIALLEKKLNIKSGR